jgi:hypothetical protein
VRYTDTRIKVFGMLVARECREGVLSCEERGVGRRVAEGCRLLTGGDYGVSRGAWSLNDRERQGSPPPASARLGRRNLTIDGITTSPAHCAATHDSQRPQP